MADSLLPDRHKQRDFFTCDIFDSFKDDIASMEHPVFSLSKKPDHRMLKYERNGTTIKIKPSYTGLATIFDKDILLYLASALMHAKNSGEAISQTVRFTSYDYIVSTNKSLGGTQYQLLKEGLERLNGTLIQTNIKTGSVEETKEFGLIDDIKSMSQIIESEYGEDPKLKIHRPKIKENMFKKLLSFGLKLKLDTSELNQLKMELK